MREPREGRFEDVRGRDATRRPCPTVGGAVQRELRLGSGEGEVAAPGPFRLLPRVRVHPQVAQHLGDLGVGEGFEHPVVQRVERVGGDELDRPGTVDANMGQDREHVAGRHAKQSSPPIEHLVVVGQQAGDERSHLRVGVLAAGDGQPRRQRRGSGRVVGVYKNRSLPLRSCDSVPAGRPSTNVTRSRLTLTVQ